ncbi:MAG TPA: zinc ABC transporter substrate-binding protein [Acidimicrobiales bacterium]|nr:zinc ABC transporter substrate-binding protein [Acidimicrobiales bacterium]
MAESRRWVRWLLVPRSGLVVVTMALAGLSWASVPAGATGHEVIDVLAAENTWGSLATQLGGNRVHVVSIVSDPNADPHEYESNPADARDFAEARYVIVNGAGYDAWASQLLGAQGVSGRKVLNVARLLGKGTAANPHFWYGPGYVERVMAKITADYGALDPADRGYFTARRAAVEAAFRPERAVLTYLRTHFSGAPVASTESIFAYLAQYVHLDLVTPSAFMQAVAEGNDPPAPSVATFYQQITAKAFRVLIYNVQTVTPLTTSLKAATAQMNIPVIGVSETIQPPIDTFEQWMTGQLSALANALNAQALGQ